MGVLKKWGNTLRILSILERLFMLPPLVCIVGPRSVERWLFYCLYFNNRGLLLLISTGLAFVLTTILTNINGFKRPYFLEVKPRVFPLYSLSCWAFWHSNKLDRLVILHQNTRWFHNYALRPWLEHLLAILILLSWLTLSEVIVLYFLVVAWFCIDWFLFHSNKGLLLDADAFVVFFEITPPNFTDFCWGQQVLSVSFGLKWNFIVKNLLLRIFT